MFGNESIHCLIRGFPGALPDKGRRRRRRRNIRHGRDYVVLVLDVDQQLVPVVEQIRLITCGLLDVRSASTCTASAIKKTYCEDFVISMLNGISVSSTTTLNCHRDVHEPDDVIAVKTSRMHQARSAANPRHERGGWILAAGDA